MELIALRYTFAGVNEFGKPQGAPLPVYETYEDSDDKIGTFEVEEDGYWAIKTYDRGDTPEHPSMAFFQICFRITGITKEEKSIYVVEIDSKNGTPLEYDEENDLWYQKTKFKDGRPKTTGAFHVDSISTAGVFIVNVKKKIGKKKIISKKVIVYPNPINNINYKVMLGRLFDINECLIRSDRSSVGVGKYKVSDNQISGEWDFELWNELKPQLEAIMKIPPDLLQKKYARTRKEKNHHFDSRVMRSVCEKSGSEYLNGISFISDTDTYENRAIKFVLTNLSNRLPIKPTDGVCDVDMHIREDVSNTFNGFDAKLFDTVLSAKKRDVSLCSKTARLLVFPKIPVANEVRVQSIRVDYDFTNSFFKVNSDFIYKPEYNKNYYPYLYYPFLYKGIPCGIRLETYDVNTALTFLEWLVDIYSFAKNNGNCSEISAMKNTVDLSFDETSGNISVYDDKYSMKLGAFYNDNGHTAKKRCVLLINDFDINISKAQFLDNNPIIQKYCFDHLTVYDFYNQVIRISQKHSSLNCIELFDKNHRNCSEILYYIAARRLRYERLNHERQINQNFNTILTEMGNFLSEKWFQNITMLSHLRLPLKRTPKFSRNKYYTAVYELLQKYTSLHPLLTIDFESNAFGLKETFQIYEYWVFCEIIQRFSNLGFEICGDSRTTLMKCFNNFISSNSKPEGFSLFMKRKYKVNGEEKTIDVLLGYNMIVGDQSYKNGRHLTPDVFIRITKETEKLYHWYFIDMKYKSYAGVRCQRKDCYDLNKEISEVAKGKYIEKMRENKFLDIMCNCLSSSDPQMWDSSYKNIIQGSYLIVADIEESEGEIAANDRLNGGNITIKHQYGAIEFYPGYEDELTTLFELIFEYKENENGLREYGTKGKNRPDSLFLCWDSSIDHHGIANPQIDTKSVYKKYKYNVTCPCGAVRFENHCFNCSHGIIKHDHGNYHKRAETSDKTSANSLWKWNFLCPDCGAKFDNMNISSLQVELIDSDSIF